jgi:uncharacterized membrane protein
MSEGRDSAHRAWLRDELPALVDGNVVDEASASRLRTHYGLDALAPTTSIAVLAFAVMGASLIGAGVLLLVAHNWDEMSRPARAALCFALLVLAQGIGAFTLARRASSSAWREASAAFLTASFGAALSLVSQTYHSQGELGDLVLGWVALMLPVVYVLDARVSAMALAMLSLLMPLGRDHSFDRGYVFLFALAALAPLVVRGRLTTPAERRTSWLELAFAFALAAGTSLLVGRDAGSLVVVWLFGLLVVFYVASPSGAGALRGGAAVAIAVTSLVLSYEGPWEELYRSLRGWGRADVLWTIAAGLVAASAALRLGTRAPARLREDAGFALVLVPAWAGFGLGLVDGSPRLAAVLFNVFVLGLGLSRLVEGLARIDRRRSNSGLGLLSMLFLLRFFDSEISFVVRGLAMVSIGVAFLVVNAYLGRHRAGAAR